MEIILYNYCGCEIARETINFQEEIPGVIAEWVINDGDYIIFKGDTAD